MVGDAWQLKLLVLATDKGYLRDGSAQTIVHAATLRQKVQIKFAVSGSHNTLPARPSTDPTSPDSWKGGHKSTIVVTGWYDSTGNRGERSQNSRTRAGRALCHRVGVYRMLRQIANCENRW